MQTIEFKNSNLNSSRLIYGCMRIAGNSSVQDKTKGKLALRTAYEAGYNHFDHADIYGGGECESLFGELLTESPMIRDNIIITSKAGIRSNPKHYDFSNKYIKSSVEGSLNRLNTDYLDLFLLHRPDYLLDADEVAETFQQLKQSGKVKHFGVSNFSPSQVNLLQSALNEPLLVNQIEINLHNISRLSDGSLDQCQQLGITPVAWCPLGGAVYPAWGNTFSAEDEQRIKNELAQQAEQYNCQPWQIVLAWLLKLPAKVCPIIGSTTPERIIAAKDVFELNYSRTDWYSLLKARNAHPVP